MKKQTKHEQGDMFPSNPIIVGLGIADFKLKEGTLIATLTGSTLASDAAQINDETWRKAIAEWLVNLCGNGEIIHGYIDEARAEAYEREQEREATRKAMEKVKTFPSGEFSGAV